MAVKSCSASLCASLMNEKSVLEDLTGCPQIIRCFGGDFSVQNGERFYNLLFEYAARGALADEIRNSGDRGLLEANIRRHTRSILKGLRYIHKNGYVHCDLKPQNVLLCSAIDYGEEITKIADFGLAKKAGEKVGVEVRGTPMYMSPEMVANGKQEAPADVWALGCLVAEMAAGAPAWRFPPDGNFLHLLWKIGVGDEVPEIPEKLSAQGKDFLGKCFVKDPRKRWSAEMLLNHPFATDLEDDLSAAQAHGPPTSPTCPLDFPDWDSTQSSCSITPLPSPGCSTQPEKTWNSTLPTSPADRLRRLAMAQEPDWIVSDTWVTVR